MTPGPAKVEIRTPPGWSVREDGGRLGIDLKVKDFMTAVGLVNEIAMIAEAVDHHPDLSIHGWNKVTISTYSHDVGRLTERDERLAARIHHLLTTKGLANK